MRIWEGRRAGGQQGHLKEKIRIWSGICRCMGRHMGRGIGRTGEERETVILFRMYNICNERNGGIKYVSRVMDKANLDLRGLPRYQGHGQDSHASVGRLPRPHGRHAKPAPRGSGCILPGCAPLSSRGLPSAWGEHY